MPRFAPCAFGRFVFAGRYWSALRGTVAAPRRCRSVFPVPDLIYDLAERCARHGWRLFLLGAAPGVAAAAGTVLQARYPGLVIAGSYAGSPAPAENDAIVARINAGFADMLFVAYGAPNQDKWIARNRAALSTVRVAIGVGGALDFVTGKAIRAPKQVQMVHLEWFIVCSANRGAGGGCWHYRVLYSGCLQSLIPDSSSKSSIRHHYHLQRTENQLPYTAIIITPSAPHRAT